MNYVTKFYTTWNNPKKNMTISKTGDWRSKRPVVNMAKCRQCGWCYVYCPTMCIETSTTGYFEPNLNFCKGCGICAYECPAEAISMQVEEEV